MSQKKPSPSARVMRETFDGLSAATVERVGLRELFVTARPVAGLRAMFEDVRRVVRAAGATVLAMDVFGVPADGSGRQALRDAWGEADWPVTWLTGGKAGGVQARAVAGADVQRVRRDGRVVGSVFEDGLARHCILGDLRPADSGAPRPDQAQETFDRMAAALGEAGMDFSNVVRTWFYLADILSWYDQFNQVRTELFRRMGVFEGLVPASTGIGSQNAADAAVIADAYAVRPTGQAVKAFAVPSPLQGPATAYGSSFSRAVEVEMPDHRRLLISGTASIDRAGNTAHPGDVAKQIELTMEVAGAILESRRMRWADVTRAVGYVKHGGDAGVLEAHLARKGLKDMPILVTESTVCRDNLLFEIELDAVAPAL